MNKTRRRFLHSALATALLLPLASCDDEEEKEAETTKKKLESDDSAKRKEGLKEAREKYRKK